MPTKSAMQSGDDSTRIWKLDFDQVERWENPLMGWDSSSDPVQGLHLQFNSREDAIVFAERHGNVYNIFPFLF